MPDHVRIPPRREIGLCRNRTTGRGRCQRAALTFAKVDAEVRSGQLRQFVEGRGEAAGGRVGIELPGDLDEDAPWDRLGHQVDREQAAERVVVWRGQVDAARDRSGDDWAGDAEVTDLRLAGATRS